MKMHKIEIENLISIVQEGTNDEGFVGIKCNFDIRNSTPHLWDKIECKAFFFNAKNEFLSHYEDAFDCALMPGDVHSLDLSHNTQITYKLDPMATGEAITCILYARAFHDFKIDLGTHNLPAQPNTHVNIEGNHKLEGLNFLTGIMHTDSPDRRKRVICKIMFVVQNRTTQRLDIKISGEPDSDAGIEFTEYNQRADPMWQGEIEARIDTTTDKLKDARINLYAWATTVVASTEPY
jgi:hypothetical protein